MWNGDGNHAVLTKDGVAFIHLAAAVSLFVGKSVARSTDDPGEASIAAGEGRRNSEFLLHGSGSTTPANTLEEKRQENFA
ncbi:hypothetical protein HZH66_010020 [Vespula vulgaris]|uniref:Uncharacterized protein n=1 Tax=Vespula vulgaris TaxID=7454 RepID=A0A834JI87_VESVU|nr:hypothetical protein HZH66_010020 [Vespula vulgaris]